MARMYEVANARPKEIEEFPLLPDAVELLQDAQTKQMLLKKYYEDYNKENLVFVMMKEIQYGQLI